MCESKSFKKKIMILFLAVWHSSAMCKVLLYGARNWGVSCASCTVFLISLALTSEGVLVRYIIAPREN